MNEFMCMKTSRMVHRTLCTYLLKIYALHTHGYGITAGMLCRNEILLIKDAGFRPSFLVCEGLFLHAGK